MAKTSITSAGDNAVRLWNEQLFRDTVKESYFAKFQGKTADSLVQLKSDLDGKQGDRVTFTLRMRLQGDGVTTGQTLEGNEESLTTYTQDLYLARYRHGVRDAGALDRQRPIWDMDTESRSALKDWGSEKIDKLHFEALAASPTKVFYKTSAGTLATATAATAKAALTATDSKLTLPMISFIKTWAQTGGARTQTPLRPVKVGGKPYYVLLVHPDVTYDLRNDSTYQQAMREAEMRGSENPLFTDAEAVWNGVVVHSHENVTIATDGGGSTVPWAHCHFMGAQSLLWAWGARPKVIAETFDYEEEHGYGWAITAGVAKAKFNSKDFAAMSVYLARTNVAGA